MITFDKIKKGLDALYRYYLGDKIVAVYPDIKAKKHRVNLFEYHPERFYDSDILHNESDVNLGDSLGAVVTSWMLEQKGLSFDMWVKDMKHFNCIGSNVFESYQHATIWGAGCLNNPEERKLSFLYKYPFSRFDFRAVRGPLTRDAVLKFGHKCPVVYGDPAILMPFIYQPKRDKKEGFLVISQFCKETEFRKKHPDLQMISMNTDNYELVIDTIASYDKLVTSSLHGVILAEAYGIPSVCFRELGKDKDFKYLDYYYSTGRYDVKIADSFEEALEMEPMPLPDLKSLQDGLLKTFPYDLWE